MNKLGTASAFASAARDLNFTALRKDVEDAPPVLVIAPSNAEAQELGDILTGTERAHTVHVASLDETPTDLKQYEAIVLFDPTAQPASRTLLQMLNQMSGKAAVAAFPGSNPHDMLAHDEVRKLIVTKHVDRAAAYGRHYPAFRSIAAKTVIDDAAKRNTRFAVASSIPSLIPVIGNVAVATADLIVMTKHQIEMVFRLAAIYGRDLHDHWGILQELAPVVGAGFLWRTIAREAADFLPFAAGAAPKIAIAYTGTQAVGRSADYYYRTGRRASREQLAGYYDTGLAALRRLNLPGLSRKDRNELEAEFRLIDEATGQAPPQRPGPGEAVD